MRKLNIYIYRHYRWLKFYKKVLLKYAFYIFDRDLKRKLHIIPYTNKNRQKISLSFNIIYIYIYIYDTAHV